MSKRYLLSVIVLLAMVLASCAPAATPTQAPAAEPVQTEAPAAQPAATEAPVEEPVATEAPAAEPTAEPAPVEAAGTLRISADGTRAPILEDLADEVLATNESNWLLNSNQPCAMTSRSPPRLVKVRDPLRYRP